MVEKCTSHHYITTQKGKFVCTECGHVRISTRKTKRIAKIISILIICAIASVSFYYANTNGATQKFLMFVSEQIPNASQQIQKENTVGNDSIVSNKNSPVATSKTTPQTSTDKLQTMDNSTSKTIQKPQTQQPSTSPAQNDNTVIPPQNTPVKPQVALAELRNYALQLINEDRIAHGLSPVTLSNNQAAQVQAEDMLKMQVLSHYMSDGEKPYMIYTKYGGLGNVAQNADTTKYDNPSQCQSSLVICTVIDPETEIQKGELRMMFDDVACCNNGHRDNILDRHHTDVSIGIAYDKYSFFMTQNFEDNYLSFTKPTSENNGIVTFTGNLKSGSLTNIGIFYDPLPTKEIYEQHKNDGFYKLGDNIVTVDSPPEAGSYYPPSNETFEVADKLVQIGNYVDVSFDLSPFVTKAGVYTVVAFLQDGADPFPITSYSITKTFPMVQDGFKSPKVNYACTQNQLDQYDQLQQQYDTLQKQYDSMPKTATSSQEYQRDMQMYNQLNSLQNQMENFRC